MTSAEVSAYCLAKPGSKRTKPFGPDPTVFKVATKMFALVGHWQGREIVSLKCDPVRSGFLRTSFDEIVPGYHLNKEHWNTLFLDGALPRSLVAELVDHSYELVATSRRRPSRPRRASAARSRGPAPRRRAAS